MIKGFIKNYNLIQEDSKVDDLLDFTVSTTAFANKLEAIDGPCIIGLIGQFGVGKSTMLHQLSIKRAEREKWIKFDAWKYPDRSDLWEGFVLDIADQVGDRKKVKKKIEGKETKSQILDIATDVVSELSDKIPNLNFLDKIKEIFKTSPAKRVFEIQEILAEILNKQSRSIIITIEDIDRSGDAGIFFLETLKQFMREAALINNVKVIVPISDKKYWEYRDSYYKCLDYKVDFLPIISGFDKFVEAIFEDSLFEGEKRDYRNRIIWNGQAKKGQIVSFCKALFADPSTNIRLLKTILRNADSAFKHQILDGHEPDWRLTICFEASKYYLLRRDPNETFFESFKRQRIVPANTFSASFLFTIHRNSDSIFEMSKSESKPVLAIPGFDYTFVVRGAEGNAIDLYPSWPWHRKDYEKEGFYVCDFYLNY